MHGLGGSPDSFYCQRMAQAAHAEGMACLRISLRGADRSGTDFYHAGLVAGLAAVVASDALSEYQRIYVVGYSLGGHVTLRHALVEKDPCLRGGAALCAPLDLSLSQQAIDRRRAVIYRHAVLSGIKEIYAQVARHRDVPTKPSEVMGVTTLLRWDELTIVPRFASAEQYYREMSLGPLLDALRVSALLIQNVSDPMVPPWTYDRFMESPIDRLRVEHMAGGGHVAFSNPLNLGQRLLGPHPRCGRTRRC